MWRLDRFGNTILPTCGVRLDRGTTDASNTVVPTSGGNYDPIGYGYTYLAPLTLTMQAVVTGTSDYVASTVAELRAMTSRRDKLYRRMDDDAVQWCDARCQGVDVTMRDTAGMYADVTITWRAEMPWYGHRRGPGWTLDSGKHLDTGLYFDEGDGLLTDISRNAFKFSLPYLGTYPSDNMTVRILAAASDDFERLGVTVVAIPALAWWPHSRLILTGSGAGTDDWYVDYHNLRVLTGTGPYLPGYTDAYSRMEYDVPYHNQAGFGVLIPVANTPSEINVLEILPVSTTDTYTAYVTWWEAYT